MPPPLVVPAPPAAVGTPPVRPAEPAAPGDSNNGARRASEHSQYGASGSPPPAAATGSGFDFGSYGRIGIGSDLKGHTGYDVNIVSFGSRLEKQPYLELNFYYGGNIGENSDRRWRVIFVPAYSGDLFHYTGDFSQNFAIRNAYAEVENLGVHGLTLWAGSRMYRGDDVYLFDFWPLDNLNTVGGDAFYRVNQNRTIFALHVGMNRLDNLYQYQTVQVPSKNLPPDSTVLGSQPATSTATTLDRPRLVLSFKATHFLRSLSQLPNAKLILYGEFHYLPAGERQAPQAPETGLPTDPLPADYGYVIGAQLGGWLRSFVFANLFFRYAGGLAAYGDLSTPYGFDLGRQVASARSVTVAWSANWEGRHGGMMSAAYFRNQADASGADDQGYNEGAVAIRPTVYFTKYLHTAFEFSYQVRRPAMVDQDQARYLLPQVFRGSIIPIVAPLGQGTYSRPIIYAIYTLSILNSDAQYYKFAAEDVRANQAFVHYLGLGVEWWFNSSYR
jgi:maltoporin